MPLVIAHLDKPALESQAAPNLATVRFVYCVIVDRPHLVSDIDRIVSLNPSTIVKSS